MKTLPLPLELREYYRLWTREDAMRGLVPLKLPTGPVVGGHQPFDLFVRVGLQYRGMVKSVLDDGHATTGWSAWMDCPTVLEGYELPGGKEKAPLGASEGPAEGPED
jgi:hypothetical protein